MNSRQRRKAAAERHNFLLDEAEAYAEDRRRYPAPECEVHVERGSRQSVAVMLALAHLFTPYTRR